LVDVFSPTYGSYFPLGRPAFQLTLASTFPVFQDWWMMGLLPRVSAQQILRFRIFPGAHGNYLVARLGQTANADGTNGTILHLRIDGVEFNLHLTTRSFGFFDLFFGDGNASHVVDLYLRSDINNLRGVTCPIRQFELYNTIRVFPGEPPVATA